MGKHRGVKIVRVVELGLRAGRNHRGEPTLKTFEFTAGYTVVGMNCTETLPEVRLTIDRLIPQIMQSCGVTEKEAVKLLNEN